MPTQLPVSPRRHDDRCLTFSQTVAFLILIARVRILDMRLSALYERAERRRQEPHGPTLLRLIRRWLAIHERIAGLLPGIPEPPHVQEVRNLFQAMKSKQSARYLIRKCFDRLYKYEPCVSIYRLQVSSSESEYGATIYLGLIDSRKILVA